MPRCTPTAGGSGSSTSVRPTAPSSTASGSARRAPRWPTAAGSRWAAPGSSSASGRGDHRPMSELTLTLLRLGFLALLWLLVLSILGVLRRDLFGTRIERRAPPPAGPAPLAGPGPAVNRRPHTPEPRPALRTLVVTEGSLRGTTL